MIEFSIKDYVSLLTLNFVFKENSFCLADYKGNVPLFPSTDETYINPLLRKYLIREKKTFELSDNTYIPDIIILCLRLLKLQESIISLIRKYVICKMRSLFLNVLII